jgi:hypothetical protein
MAEERVRLLICADCKSIEELPAYDGPQEHDDTGNYRMAQHRYGSDGPYHPTTVGDVAKKDWDKPTVREAIVQKITTSLGGDEGLGREYYDVKSNFQQDAIGCWKRHNRTTDCGDYMSEPKRLDPGTRRDRIEAGITPRRPSTFLCQFCPVQSVKMQLRRAAKGAYDRKPWEPS